MNISNASASISNVESNKFTYPIPYGVVEEETKEESAIISDLPEKTESNKLKVEVKTFNVALFTLSYPLFTVELGGHCREVSKIMDLANVIPYQDEVRGRHATLALSESIYRNIKTPTHPILLGYIHNDILSEFDGRSKSESPYLDGSCSLSSDDTSSEIFGRCLCIAAFLGYEIILKQLVESRGEKKLKDPWGQGYGFNAIYCVLNHRPGKGDGVQERMVQYLIDNGAPLTFPCPSKIMAFSELPSIINDISEKSLKILLKNISDAKTSFFSYLTSYNLFHNKTALQEVTWNSDDDRLKVIKLLIKMGAKRGTLVKKDKLSEEFLDATKSGSIVKMSYFLNHLDVDINYQDEKGCSALHLAASKRKEEAVNFLLKFGANPKLKNSDNLDYLQYAQKCLKKEAPRRLVEIARFLKFPDNSSFKSAEECMSFIPNLNLSYDDYAPAGFLHEALLWWREDRVAHEQAKKLVNLFLEKGADPLIVIKEQDSNAVDVLSDMVSHKKFEVYFKEVSNTPHVEELESIFKECGFDIGVSLVTNILTGVKTVLKSKLSNNSQITNVSKIHLNELESLFKLVRDHSAKRISELLPLTNCLHKIVIDYVLPDSKSSYNKNADWTISLIKNIRDRDYMAVFKQIIDMSPNT